MKKILFSVFIFLFFLSCSDEPEHRISGQWQLKEITENGLTSKVDTLFYSFQRGVIFAFTALINPDSTSISYGYLDFPSEREMVISMDTTKDTSGSYYLNMPGDFKRLSGWDDYTQQFRIEKIDHKKLILSSASKIYYFNKY